jgi:uncharacterized protein YjiS (DUF1127 family)
MSKSDGNETENLFGTSPEPVGSDSQALDRSISPARLRHMSPIEVVKRVLRSIRVKDCLAEWRRRARSRHELSNLDDRTLMDICVSRAAARFEASKAFWAS